ncbi:MAG: zinc ABC transporter substrate-binding protein [Planctomycetales bacterium]
MHLEGKMGEVFENLARRKKTIPIADSLPKDRLLGLEAHFADPHVWFDVSLWSETIAVVAATLSEMAPQYASEFKSRAADYKAQLEKLHQECRTEFATIPEPQRILVTAHDAFHYLGKAYGLQVKAIQGISTESEAGVKQINELVAFIAKNKIKAVFIESSVSDRAVKALVEGCSQTGHAVKIGGELFSDAMGKPGTPEGTYPGMVRHNLHTIVNALK